MTAQSEPLETPSDNKEPYIPSWAEHSLHQRIKRKEALIAKETPSELDDSTHYHRTCMNCGKNWWGLHCPHDGYQNNCPNCNIRPHTVVTPENGCDCEFVVPVIEAEQAITRLLAEARIDSLQWSLNDLNMPDTDTRKNIQGFIDDLRATLTNTESKDE